ncbi:MAG: FIST C-terminal domain-containing protein, partial [Phycisphaerales bacterium]|nr:FIST C-terminal domain-containing protein [Phycisphaerales bacterium]
MSPTQPAGTNLRVPTAASAISGHFDTRTAATEVADALFEELGSPAPSRGMCDLLVVFGSFHHRAAFTEAADIMRKTISPSAMIGVTAESVLGSDRELEGVAGLSAIAFRLPAVSVHPWHSTPEDPIPLREPEKIRQRIGLDKDPSSFRAAIMLADPFTTPITRLLPALTNCRKDQPALDVGVARPRGLSHATLSTQHSELPVIVIGGMASGASQPGFNVLVLNDRVLTAGAVGVSLSGNLDIDFILSQGCKPVGKPVVITKSKDNIILELGGRKALEVLQEIAQSLPDADRELLSKGLLVGTVINEYKDHFGRGDFLVRNVMGLDQKHGGIAVGEMCRVGQTIQFHARDAATAAEDLQLLLDSQVMSSAPPFGALLFSCNGRGQRLFGQPNHDINIIRERLGDIPLAGFFAAGEIGPIGTR